MKQFVLLLFSLTLSSLLATVYAGVFAGTVNCNNPGAENFCAQGMTNNTNPEEVEVINARGIIHPLGFTGSPKVDVLTIPICVSPDSSDLIGPTQRAIAIWQDFTPMTGQCRHCRTHEEGSNVPEEFSKFFAESVILHELGHCAMGLGHSDLQFDPPGGADAREPTSFTMSYNASSMGIDDGRDNIRGSFDDTQVAGGGMLPDSVHWFRRSDNNPLIVDGTTIDTDTYSRQVSNLPEGHGWAANGNRVVAESLGFPETQNVMYSAIAARQRYVGLTADDINMVKMGMTGRDFTAGTADDYTIELLYVEDCQDADLEIGFAPSASLGETTMELAACFQWIDFTLAKQNPVLANHYSIFKVFSFPRLLIHLNPGTPWDFSEEIFYDSFESGSTSEWTGTLP